MSIEVKTIIVLCVALIISILLNVYQGKARDKQALRFCDLLDAQKWERYHLGTAVEEQQKKILALEVDNEMLTEENKKLRAACIASDNERKKLVAERDQSWVEQHG